MTSATGANIHPTAIVADGATLAPDVTIGPYCLVGANVNLGAGVKLHGHANVDGDTEVGAGTQIFPFASIGTIPQDLKFRGEATKLVIGERCMIREHATMNPGTEGGGSLTKVGDDCLFMMGTHVAHDCIVGNQVIMANNATLAGHVEVGDCCVLGGFSGVHQFARIGAHAMIGGMTGVERDVIPFGSVIGNRAHLAGLNLVGMKRRGFDREEIHTLRGAFRTLFEGEDGALQERAAKLSAELPDGESATRTVIDFVLAGGSRHFCVPRET